MARYYPNGSGGNRKSKKDDPNPILDPGVDSSVTLENNAFSEWLYGDYDEQKFKTVSLLLHTPGVSNYVNYLLDYRQDTEYMRRYQLDYSDIHDPRKLRTSSTYGALAAATFNFVSDNVKRLYR